MTPRSRRLLRALVLAALFVGLAFAGLRLLARDACLKASGELVAGDICVIAGVADQHMYGLLRFPLVLLALVAAAAITTGLAFLVRRF